ncbi:hypothetical protein K2Y11_06375 [bacterium]|nr:hypothetical protein [bacterium]
MAADLSAYGLFQRRELLLDDDALLDLENGFGSDRVRRVLFERVQTVIAWTNVLVGWLVFAIISLTIGIVFLIPFFQGQDSPVVPFGFIFAPIGLVFTLRYLLVQRYHLLIRMIDGTEHRIDAIAMPGKFRRFVRRLTDSISAFQASESARREPAR